MSNFIVLGSPAVELTALEELARSRESVTWTVNRHAQCGDKIFFYLTAPVSSLVAHGIVASTPQLDDNGEWTNHHMAEIVDVVLLPKRVHIKTLRARFPEWGWLLSPIKSSKIPDQVVNRLRTLTRVADAGQYQSADFPDVDTEAIVAAEGSPQFVLHLRRERSKKLIELKRASVLRTKGCLACEACGFEFAARYGSLAPDYCEVHHLAPLAKMKPNSRTTLADLAVLCSNCHRVIHLAKPMLTPRQLASRLRGRSKMPERTSSRRLRSRNAGS